METTMPQANSVCTCNHFAPDVRVLRSVPFNRDQATFYVRGNLPANAVLDWTYLELLEHHSGTLHDLGDQPIDLDLQDANGDTLLDHVFSADPARFINRYRARSQKPGRNRLDIALIRPVLLLHYARQISICRTQGRCARRAD